MNASLRIDELILRWRGGDDAARDRLVELLYPELRTIASAQMRRERHVSFSSGDLINDAILKLVRMGRIDIADRNHVIALAARLMRNILVDHARQKGTDKRHHHKVELNADIDGGQRIDLISLESALTRLGAIDAQLAELVEMRYFGGMAMGDIAEVTGLSEATLKRRWRTARAWLQDAIENRIDG
ncbi:ECF-type sigma factor [Sandaracinobacteroides hominis]|uniref:ECF-type sigma factor n=1 Tax=Sandaracinobacteroides hominis TaxID=2780086 RepID=UPI0018F74927|nr:ECF-type sigma factor [Sandaracinobacteroides hominis]